MRFTIFPLFKKDRRIILLDDYNRLLNEISLAEQKYVIKFRDVKKLKKILLNSEKTGKENINRNVITMNCACKVYVINTSNTFTLKLVYPGDTNFTSYCISVFSSFGVALLGKKTGDIITYGCKKRNKVKILSVLPYATI